MLTMFYNILYLTIYLQFPFKIFNLIFLELHEFLFKLHYRRKSQLKINPSLMFCNIKWIGPIVSTSNFQFHLITVERRYEIYALDEGKLCKDK